MDTSRVQNDFVPHLPIASEFTTTTINKYLHKISQKELVKHHRTSHVIQIHHKCSKVAKTTESWDVERVIIIMRKILPAVETHGRICSTHISRAVLIRPLGIYIKQTLSLVWSVLNTSPTDIMSQINFQQSSLTNFDTTSPTVCLKQTRISSSGTETRSKLRRDCGETWPKISLMI